MNLSLSKPRELAVRLPSSGWHGAIFTALLLALFPTSVLAEGNSIVVESKVVLAGSQNVRIAIFVKNEESINFLYLPLEIRSINPGSFVSKEILALNPSGRVANSGLGSEDPGCWSPPFENPTIWPYACSDSSNRCSGPVSRSYGFEVCTDTFLSSPDAWLLEANGLFCGSLEAGADPTNPDSSSIYFLVDVNRVAGSFEIDTCCIGNRHLWYNTSQLTPEFNKGTIEIVCDCTCHGDSDCNQTIDVVDVINAIDRAFRGSTATNDIACSPHGTVIDGRTDTNCSGSTDIVDVVLTINVAFRGANRSVLFCSPCQ